MKPILIIEDEHALAAALAAICRRLGCEVQLCSSGQRALDELARGDFALAVLDIGLPDMSGLIVLEHIRAHAPQLPALIVTAHANLDNAVAAKKLGAAAYLVKPLDLHEVQETIRQLLSAAPSVPAPPRDSLAQLVGAAPAMQRSFVEIAHACATDAPVLITGPTGTGKTLTARVIHANSTRRDAPFVTLHCSALPETLLESELFGHEKNSFTGAGTARAGHIERAQGGTLFLDEIADISPAIQAKLLRFVEERTFTRIGGREDLRVDLRLITATNKNLRDEVRAGRFREDLYYRLHVLEIALPSLHERADDLPALAASFLATLAPDRHAQLSPTAAALLQRHDWPGNVRELRNVLEHAIAVSNGGVILPQHLPRNLRDLAESVPSSAAQPLETALAAWLQQKLREGACYREMHDALEAMALRHLLAHFDGKPTILARETKMNRVTLRRKTRLLGEAPPEA
ncbi:MAG: sigma-54 dependent transcriptional regulator [Chthoniobacter sp.]|nr:sigma-54 dependent transcriptional regulator [Chthoniobacter sp.]